MNFDQFITMKHFLTYLLKSKIRKLRNDKKIIFVIRFLRNLKFTYEIIKIQNRLEVLRPKYHIRYHHHPPHFRADFFFNFGFCYSGYDLCNSKSNSFYDLHKLKFTNDEEGFDRNECDYYINKLIICEINE